MTPELHLKTEQTIDAAFEKTRSLFRAGKNAANSDELHKAKPLLYPAHERIEIARDNLLRLKEIIRRLLSVVSEAPLTTASERRQALRRLKAHLKETGLYFQRGGDQMAARHDAASCM